MAIPFNLPSDECTIEQYRRLHQLLMDLINLLRALLNSEIPLTPNSPNVNLPQPVYATQFGFPSPPSSVPSSPSPFSPGATSFVLPDVVASAVNNNELRNLLDAQLNLNAQTSAPVEVQQAQEIRRGSTAGLNKLRKRKRARLSKKKKSADCAESHCSLAKCLSSCERGCKIPKTTGTVCSCSNAVVEETVNRRYDQRSRCCKDVPMRDQYTSSQTYRRNESKSPTWVYVGEELKRMTDGFNGIDKKNEKIPEDIETKGNGLMSQCGRTVFAAALFVLGWKLLKQN